MLKATVNTGTGSGTYYTYDLMGRISKVTPAVYSTATDLLKNACIMTLKIPQRYGILIIKMPKTSEGSRFFCMTREGGLLKTATDRYNESLPLTNPGYYYDADPGLYCLGVRYRQCFGYYKNLTAGAAFYGLRQPFFALFCRGLLKTAGFQLFLSKILRYSEGV